MSESVAGNTVNTTGRAADWLGAAGRAYPILEAASQKAMRARSPSALTRVGRPALSDIQPHTGNSRRGSIANTGLFLAASSEECLPVW